MKAEAHQGLFLQALASLAGKAAKAHEAAVRADKKYEVAATVRGRVTQGNRQWDLKYTLSGDVAVAPPKEKTTSLGAAQVLAVALAAVGKPSRQRIAVALAEADPKALAKEQVDEAKRLIAQQQVRTPGTKCVVRCDGTCEAA